MTVSVKTTGQERVTIPTPLSIHAHKWSSVTVEDHSDCIKEHLIIGLSAMKTDLQGNHHEGQLKQSIEGIEGWGRGCHHSLTSIVAASSCAPAREKQMLSRRFFSTIHHKFK